MKTNIPIFRAKKLDSDEYAEGCLNVWEQNKKVYYSIMEIGIYPSPFNNIHLIDQTTLAIHFLDISTTSEIDRTTRSINIEDMLDSQGNKIFASLQEDGKGGDIMQDDEYFGIAKYKDCQFVVEYEDCIDNIDNGNFEVIGIQE